MIILFIHYTHSLTYVMLEKYSKIVVAITIMNTMVSKELLVMIQQMLHDQRVSVFDITKICVNTGPFSVFTQRSLLATINGFALGIRLSGNEIQIVSVDGFELLYTAYQENNYDHTVIALYNAYGNDLFYLYKKDQLFYKGLVSAENFTKTIEHVAKDKKLFVIGNITEKQQTILKNLCKNPLEIDVLYELTGEQFWKQYYTNKHAHSEVDYLFPLYAKNNDLPIMTHV